MDLDSDVAVSTSWGGPFGGGPCKKSPNILGFIVRPLSLRNFHICPWLTTTIKHLPPMSCAIHVIILSIHNMRLCLLAFASLYVALHINLVNLRLFPFRFLSIYLLVYDCQSICLVVGPYHSMPQGLSKGPGLRLSVPSRCARAGGSTFGGRCSVSINLPSESLEPTWRLCCSSFLGLLWFSG